MKYKQVADVSVTSSRKCDCPFKLRGKPISTGDGWMLKVICGLYNHALSQTLVGHPYAGRLKRDEHELVVNMTKSQVRSTNILLSLKEKNTHNVTTIKQLYNARYTYKWSVRGPRKKCNNLWCCLSMTNIFIEVGVICLRRLWVMCFGLTLILWNCWTHFTLFCWWITLIKQISTDCHCLR